MDEIIKKHINDFITEVLSNISTSNYWQEKAWAIRDALAAPEEGEAKILTYDYDQDAGVMYITFGERAKATRTAEDESGIVIRFSDKRLLGITIVDFCKRTNIPSPKEGNLLAHPPCHWCLDTADVEIQTERGCVYCARCGRVLAPKEGEVIESNNVCDYCANNSGKFCPGLPDSSNECFSGLRLNRGVDER